MWRLHIPLLFYLIASISGSLASDDFVIKEAVIKPGGVGRSVSIEGVCFGN